MISHVGALSARVRLEPLDLAVPVENVVAAFGRQSCPAILESSLDVAGTGRFSTFAANPVRTLAIEVVDSAGLREAFNELCFEQFTSPERIPFAGGWIGYVGYEAGLALESVPRVEQRSLGLPDLRFALYDTAVVFDHAEERWYVAGIEWNSKTSFETRPIRDRLDEMATMLRGAANCGPSDLERKSERARGPEIILRPSLDHEEYLARVRRIQDLILDGEVYQVNLTQRWEAALSESPLEIYQRLRRISPSPFAAFLQWPDAAILSSSPELFLDVRGRHVTTRPIKGTRPRGKDAESDRALRRELENSEKDRAELNMIVDVLRNDLGRVCDYGSMMVRSAGDIESHPTVFHRVATIEGRLGEDRGLAELIMAAFPGGSVTGAPKIRAMQIISELEPTPRGVYCGAIGWIGLDGNMTMNLAIRTMIATGGRVYLHAGGGITIDSDAEEEYRETLTKLRGMARAIGAEIE